MGQPASGGEGGCAVVSPASRRMRAKGAYSMVSAELAST